MSYALLRPLLFRIPAERAHHLAMGALRATAKAPLGEAALRRLRGPLDPALETRLNGHALSSPIGLAAGFDKDAIAYDALGQLGFGFVEIGTVTPKPQPGNPKPRLFRLPADHALINRMGFNNEGAERAARRLDRPRSTVVGVNLGKNKSTPQEEAVDDYRRGAELLAAHADYLVVNVSSPNTPGLRALQGADALRPILDAVAEVCVDLAPPPPLFVKIAPDLDDEAVDEVCDLALELELAGIVATNTTISRAGLKSDPREIEAAGAGGLSGAPLEARALAVLQRLRARAGTRLMLIAAGGIGDAHGAWARIRAGASLLQVYTSFVYGGPTFPGELGRDLARLAKAAGYERISDAVGADVTA